MRAVLGLIVVLGAAGWLVYEYGGFKSFDPSKQGKEAREQIQPGMSWKKVVDVAGEPREYQAMQRVTKMIGGQEQVLIKPGPANKFNAGAIQDRIDGGTVEDGFQFSYRFSQSVAYTVVFDANGDVRHVADNATITDLLDMRD